MNENNINTVEDFKELNTVENIEETVNLDKSTTKGLRVTERTKRRYNAAEKNSGLSQEDFANRLLDLCEMFGKEDTEKTPEFIELTNIINRIPEIFLGIVSKYQVAESSAVSRLSKQIEGLTLERDSIKKEHDELKKTSDEEISKLQNDLTNLDTNTKLALKEKEEELSKKAQEINQLADSNKTLKRDLSNSQDKLSELRVEYGNYIENTKEKDKTISNLNKEVQDLNSNILNLTQEKNKIELEFDKHKNEVENYKLKLENNENLREQQKKMYEDQIEQLKKLLDTKK